MEDADGKSNLADKKSEKSDGRKIHEAEKNSYLNNSETIENMKDQEYRLAGYVEELDRFLNKALNGQTTVDDL